MLLVQGKHKAENVCDPRIVYKSLQLRGCMPSLLQTAPQV